MQFYFAAVVLASIGQFQNRKLAANCCHSLQQTIVVCAMLTKFEPPPPPPCCLTGPFPFDRAVIFCCCCSNLICPDQNPITCNVTCTCTACMLHWHAGILYYVQCACDDELHAVYKIMEMVTLYQIKICITRSNGQNHPIIIIIAMTHINKFRSFQMHSARRAGSKYSK